MQLVAQPGGRRPLEGRRRRRGRSRRSRRLGHGVGRRLLGHRLGLRRWRLRHGQVRQRLGGLGHDGLVQRRRGRWRRLGGGLGPCARAACARHHRRRRVARPVPARARRPPRCAWACARRCRRRCARAAAAAPATNAPGSPAPPGRARRRGGAAAGSSHAQPLPAQRQRRRRRLVVELELHAAGAARRAASRSSVRRRWSRTSVSSKAWPGRVQPRASSSRRRRQPSTASSSSPALTPARSAALPRSTLFTWMPLSAPSLTRRPSSAARSAAVGLPGDAGARQQRLQRQVVGAVHPGGQFRVQRAAGHLLQRLRDVGLVDGAAAAGCPQLAHHLVERAAVGAQAQVQRQRHQAALGVVADGGVGRVLVAAVVLDPGIEAGLRPRSAACAPAWPARR